MAVAALTRTAAFAAVFDEELLAFTIIPRRKHRVYERPREVQPGEEFDTAAVADDLRNQVRRVAPDATYRYEAVEKYAGHTLIGVSRFGGAMVADDAYHVGIVRQSPETMG